MLSTFNLYRYTKDAGAAVEADESAAAAAEDGAGGDGAARGRRIRGAAAGKAKQITNA